MRYGHAKARRPRHLLQLLVLERNSPELAGPLQLVWYRAAEPLAHRPQDRDARLVLASQVRPPARIGEEPDGIDRAGHMPPVRDAQRDEARLRVHARLHRAVIVELHVPRGVAREVEAIAATPRISIPNGDERRDDGAIDGDDKLWLHHLPRLRQEEGIGSYAVCGLGL